MLCSRLLPYDRARSREKGQPLCMEQYYRLFNTYRFPGVVKDRLVTTSADNQTCQPQHIVVAHKDHVIKHHLFFVVDKFKVHYHNNIQK